VDQLGEDERKIHAEIQKLEEECAGDTQKFQKKFGPLRVKVFDNLRTGEKMIFQDKKLKTDFAKKVHIASFSEVYIYIFLIILVIQLRFSLSGL